jgi:RHH-type proline utilization regulon transcriptional repressor/proline dehydrogenase/delta 1-pyrroline-5-carboxylate dehydrogenase
MWMSHPSVAARIAAAKRTPLSDDALVDEAVRLAADLLACAQAEERPPERKQSARMARLMNDPVGKAFTLALADQVFRPPTAHRAASQFRHLLSEFGPPRYLDLAERFALRLGAPFSTIVPGLVMPAVTRAMRTNSAGVILPAEPAALKPLLDRRHAEGFRMNLNQLGEAILGEEEAARRLEANLARLASPDCDCLSVKISAICSQIHLVGETQTLARIADRLRQLYRAAIANPVNGSAKRVTLDMEEYRDLHLTCDVFRQVLDEPEFLPLEAGIVLQAYLPDAWPMQKELIAWAKTRRARGGAGIRIRLVKGANLAMESVDAELNGWPLAPYASKEETDANFKRMLHEACRPESAAVARHGVASHNLFDLAYALLLRSREGVEDRIEFEMLEGMANAQARAVRSAAGDLLLYAPVVKREDFHSAIAYLVRRLDENTSPENFLHDLFALAPGNPAWLRQDERFRQACARTGHLATGPNRRQNRQTERTLPLLAGEPFRNAPNTDFSLPVNRRWIRELAETFHHSPVPDIPLVIAGNEEAGESLAIGRDPSRPEFEAYRHALAGSGQIERALVAAVAARANWLAIGFDERAQLLRQAATELANARGEAIATMMLDAGKSVMEADVEVSEAIDFANYYAQGFSADGFDDGCALTPFGTVLVTPPWNFPFAIPCGGILAALMAGNTVILKPAPETVLTAWLLANCLWRAGIPRDVLQFLPCSDDETGRSLVTDDRIGAVILTGAYETARMFLGWKPSLLLFAETSGKNALLITAAADADLAIKDLVRSAFGHAGQKCSAASLAIVEAELHDHPAFLRQLRDAAASLRVASPWELDATVTPVIREPGEALKRALTRLEPGESWLLEPRQIDGNPLLWSPGIKLGVDPSSWYRRTECFGPVLGIIRADDFAHSLRIQNDSEFGLTAGLHSLDDREIAVWREQIEAGNAYINRPITGAIVQRQPFGGWKHSGFGPGSKAGGPNYCQLFGTWRNEGLPLLKINPSETVAALLAKLFVTLPTHTECLAAAAGSDAYWHASEFSLEHDPSGLRCESNVFRYRKFPQAIIRVSDDLPDVEVARLLLIPAAMNILLEVSLRHSRPWLEALGLTLWIESDETLTSRLKNGPRGSVVLRAPHAGSVLEQAALEAMVRFANSPVLWSARLEWLAWLREQSISETRHRYGNRLPNRKKLGD